MKKQPIYIFIISLFFTGVWLPSAAQNQADSTEKQVDSIVYKEKYGLRLGVDLSKPIRSFIEKQYSGFEIQGDYRISDRFYPAAELGYEEFKSEENTFSSSSKGAFLKLGANMNVYDNWIGMQNEIYVGLRYGISSFSETLYDYTINNRDQYFEPDHRPGKEQFKNLSAHWIEFQIGIKAEVLNNLFLGIHGELKRMVHNTSPQKFDNLWIPGYNRNYDHSAFGVGWGYTISYLIPLYKKKRKQEK